IGLASLLALVSIALCWQFGKQAYARREEVANLAARAELATVSERNRIAREMHDIVAHSLTVVIAQADGGRYAGRKDPEKAIEALETISARGREALTQMRSLLSVLHTEDNRDVTATPGISGIQDLISDANRSGAHGTLAVEGEEAPLDEAKGLTVYRVVRESLTHVIKHAGPVEVRVRLLWEGERLTVMAANAPGAEQLTGSGRGLTGIKERVRIHGGKASWGGRARCSPVGGMSRPPSHSVRRGCGCVSERSATVTAAAAESSTHEGRIFTRRGAKKHDHRGIG